MSEGNPRSDEAVSQRDAEDTERVGLPSSVSIDSIYSIGAHRRTESDTPLSNTDLALESTVVSPAKPKKPGLLKKSVSQAVFPSEEEIESQLRAVKKKPRLAKSVSFHDKVELVEINDNDNDENSSMPPEEPTESRSDQNNPPLRIRAISPKNSTKRFVQLSEDEYDFEKEDAKFRASQAASRLDPTKLSTVFNFAWLITIICVVLAVIIATIIILVFMIVFGKKCSLSLASKKVTVDKHTFPYYLTDSSNLIDHLIIQTTGDVHFYFNDLNNSTTLGVDVTHFSITEKKMEYKSSSVVYTRENKTLGVIITERYDLLSGLEGIWAGNLCSGSNVNIYLPSIARGRLKSISAVSTMKGTVYVNMSQLYSDSNALTSIESVQLHAVAGEISISNAKILNELTLIGSSAAVTVANVVATGNMTVQSESEPIKISNLATDGLLKVSAQNKFASIHVSTVTNTTGLTLSAVSSFAGTVTVDFNANVLCTETSFEARNSDYSSKRVVVATPSASESVIISKDQEHAKGGFVQSRNCPVANQVKSTNSIFASGYNDVFVNIIG